MATRSITTRAAREAHAARHQQGREAFHAAVSGLTPTMGAPVATLGPGGRFALVCHPADHATATAVSLALGAPLSADPSGAIWCDACDVPAHALASLAALGVRVRRT